MRPPFIVDLQTQVGYTSWVENPKNASEGVTQGENYDKE